MANNYLQFSAVLPGLTPEEAAWLETYLEEKTEKAEKDGDEYFPQFEYSSEGAETVDFWFRAEESGDPSQVAEAVQAFFKHFEKKDTWSLTWAATCSKMRVDEFSGGAVVVTSEEARYLSAGSWVDEQAKLIKDKWEDDTVQFARLLCELVANVEDLKLEEVAKSMDLSLDEAKELFDRAHTAWEKAKEGARG